MPKKINDYIKWEYDKNYRWGYMHGFMASAGLSGEKKLEREREVYAWVQDLTDHRGPPGARREATKEGSGDKRPRLK